MLTGGWRSIRLLVSILSVVLSSAGCLMQTGFISEQQARDIAVRSSSSGHLRATEPPNVLQAELITLEAAQKRLAESGDSDRAHAPTAMVWFVTMEGTWTLIGGPPTPAGATPVPRTTFHHYAIILDARSGEPISERATELAGSEEKDA